MVGLAAHVCERRSLLGPSRVHEHGALARPVVKVCGSALTVKVRMSVMNSAGLRCLLVKTRSMSPVASLPDFAEMSLNVGLWRAPG